MSTITVPLTPELDLFIEEGIREGFSSKAELVRQALTFYKEELALRRLLSARQEVKEGKALRGNLRDLVKNI